MKELATLTQLSPCAIRYYVLRGLFPSPVFRGTVTRYQRIHLLRGLAILRFHQQGVWSIDVIRQKFDSMEDADLLAFVCEEGVKDEIAQALELSPEMRPGENASDEKASTEAWVGVRVAPGIEVRVAADANALVRRISFDYTRS
jgi:DNA-binding transcriptional MerR regulator